MKITQVKYLKEHGKRFGSGEVLKNHKKGKAQENNMKTWKGAPFI